MNASRLTNEQQEMETWYTLLKGRIKTPKTSSSKLMFASSHVSTNKFDLSPFKTPKTKNESTDVKSENFGERLSADHSRLHQFTENELKLQTSFISKANEKIDFYSYWRQKAYDYQSQNFQLLKQKDLVKQQLQCLKQRQNKLIKQLAGSEKQSKKIQELESQIVDHRKSEKHFHVHIMKIEKQLSVNKALVFNLQHKISKNGSNVDHKNYYLNEVPLLKSLRDKVRKLQEDNNRFKYIVKEQSQDIKHAGIQSIWTSKQVLIGEAEGQPHKKAKENSLEKTYYKRMHSVGDNEFDRSFLNKQQVKKQIK